MPNPDTLPTTIEIESDVLVAARAIAEQEGGTLDSVISSLARHGLARRRPTTSRNGILVLGLPPSGQPVTLETVNALRDGLL